MSRPTKSDRVLNVASITLGTWAASKEGLNGVAFRLQLRDGTQLVFGLTEAQTIEFAKETQTQLQKISSTSYLKH